ncbi:hypothetical protein CsSME_00051604 [Camellia sinensis var. sinensis]
MSELCCIQIANLQFCLLTDTSIDGLMELV